MKNNYCELLDDDGNVVNPYFRSLDEYFNDFHTNLATKDETNFVDELRHYFDTTPKEKVLEDWKQSEWCDEITDGSVDTNLTTKDVDENSSKFRVIETNELTTLREHNVYVEFLKQKFPKTFEHTMNQFNEWKLEQNLNKNSNE